MDMRATPGDPENLAAKITNILLAPEAAIQRTMAIRERLQQQDGLGICRKPLRWNVEKCGGQRMAQMTRQAHASLDVSSRRKKAEKIARLLELDTYSEPLRLLEIGCGSGVIAHFFAMHPNIRCQVSAVDVLDQRVEIDGYQFQLVQGSQLPFDDASFDVVISNHVIEHVGDDSEQLTHLSEIRRVMKQEGSAYLAVPNRWMLTEPHYQLPFLSWLPANLRSHYLRISGKGLHYDCRPLSARAFEKLAIVGWSIRNKSGAPGLV